MTRLRLYLFLLPLVLLQAGCSSTNGTAASDQSVDANGQPVSSVPWNKPENWETSGQLGSATGH